MQHIILKFIYVYVKSLFLFITEWYSNAQIYHSLFIQSHVDGYLSCFQFQVTTNKTIMNIHVQMFAWTHAFI